MEEIFEVMYKTSSPLLKGNLRSEIYTEPKDDLPDYVTKFNAANWSYGIAPFNYFSRFLSNYARLIPNYEIIIWKKSIAYVPASAADTASFSYFTLA